MHSLNHQETKNSTLILIYAVFLIKLKVISKVRYTNVSHSYFIKYIPTKNLLQPLNFYNVFIMFITKVATFRFASLDVFTCVFSV